jgi:hypothetical protein
MAPKQLSAKNRRTHKQLHLLQASGSAINGTCAAQIAPFMPTSPKCIFGGDKQVSICIISTM